MASKSTKMSKQAREERNKSLWLIIGAGLLTIIPFSVVSTLMTNHVKYDSLEYNLISVAIYTVPKAIGIFIYYLVPTTKTTGIRALAILSFIALIFVALNLNSGLNTPGWSALGYAIMAYAGSFVYYPLVIALFVTSLVRLYHPKENAPIQKSSGNKNEKEYKDDLI